MSWSQATFHKLICPFNFKVNLILKNTQKLRNSNFLKQNQICVAMLCNISLYLTEGDTKANILIQKMWQMGKLTLWEKIEQFVKLLVYIIIGKVRLDAQIPVQCQ